MSELHPALVSLPAPRRHFASDNSAGAHPAVFEALQAANVQHALAYGSDAWTAQSQAAFRDLFGAQSESFLVWGGTGANVMALASLVQAGECVVCADIAHLAVDEAGAPERATGAKLLLLPTADGKIRPEQVAELARLVGIQHSPQPGVLSITQSTELGTLYSIAEIRALCAEARKLGMRVHLDGARLSNAVAALGGSVQALRELVVESGVDVVCFGGAKAGLLFGEAVVYLNPSYARRAKYVRKQVGQLPSKMRFVAAQFNALLQDDLWLKLAEHANRMARRLYGGTYQLPGVNYSHAPVVNGLFPTLPARVIAPLAQWCPFFTWDESKHQARWMTAWDTNEEDVDRFVAGVKALLAHK